MILVNFKGYGEWFIRDGNSLKLAIVRTTKNPFEDPLEWKPTADPMLECLIDWRWLVAIMDRRLAEGCVQ